MNLDRFDRSKYIGGGDIPSIIGEGFKTPLELWEEKIGGERPLTPELAHKFKFRKKMEPLVIEALGDLYGIVPTKVSFPEPNRYIDPLEPYFGAEIDFECLMTVDLAERFPELGARVPIGETLNSEIKTSVVTTKEWGTDRDQMPTGVAAQAQWGLGITGRLACLVIPAFGIVDKVEIRPAIRSDTVIQWLRAEASKFRIYVESRRPPPPISDDDRKRSLLRLLGEPVELTDDAYLAYEEVLVVRATINDLEKQKRIAEHKLFDYLRATWGVPVEPDADLPHEKSVLMREGQPVATYNRIKRAGYVVEPTTYRQLRRLNGKGK